MIATSFSRVDIANQSPIDAKNAPTPIKMFDGVPPSGDCPLVAEEMMHEVVVMAVAPLLSFIFRVTVYELAAVYVCVAFCIVDSGAPSPKSQRYSNMLPSGSFEPEGVKDTTSPTFAE